MKRRDFFRFGFDKSKEVVGEAVETVLEYKYEREFLRPPGALPESKFLLVCTRCGDCQDACSYGAIHLVGLNGGVRAATPFIDPYYKACEYCEDMSCVKVCQPGALQAEPNAKLGVARLVQQHCLVAQGQYCDYCARSCPPGVKAIKMNQQRFPEIDQEACVGCGKCAYICVSQTGKAITIDPL